MTVPGASDRPAVCVEWSAAGRSFPGEPVSGDAAVAVDRGGGGVLLATVDGLGHGVEAASAAERAREVVDASASEPLETVLRTTHEALARTRGATMTIATISCAGQLRWVGVGNVEARVLRRDGHRSRIVASAMLYGGVLGYRLPTVRVSTHELEVGDLVLMATDGLAPSFADDVALGDPVERVAAAVLARCARPTDDALVAAARFLGSAS
jgi:phosphoserine phosphatase RsbX